MKVNSKALGVKFLQGFVLISMCSLTACEDEVVTMPPNRVIPVVSSFSVSPNTNCMLTVSTLISLGSASFVAVEYTTDSVAFQSTPRFGVTDTFANVPVLGLKPNTSYVFRAKAFSNTGDSAVSSFVFFETDSLPSGLPTFTVNASNNPSSGYVMLGLTPTPTSGPSAAVILSNEGEIVWYRKFDGPVTDFQRQPNGRFTAYSTLAGVSHFFEMDVLGNIVNEYSAQTTSETGVHELRVVGIAEYYLYATDFRTMDLTGIGGLSNARVRGMTIEGNTTASTPFRWSTFDHLQVTDAASDISLTGANVNPWHANAIEIDNDGNILVSFRNMDEVTKINRQTGDIIWRLGGENNQFTFINDPLNGFSHQHGIRRLANGNILLFDNGNLHVPPVSRAVEYDIDETALTANMVWEYRNATPLYGFALGFAHRNENGNTLICYGAAQRILEVDAPGTIRWDISTPGNFPYRAFRINSLY